MDELLSVDEAASKLKLAPKTLRDWLRTGKLPGLKLGKANAVMGEILVSILAVFCTVGGLISGVAGLRDAMDKRKTAPPLFQQTSSTWPLFVWFALVALVSWASVLR